MSCFTLVPCYLIFHGFLLGAAVVEVYIEGSILFFFLSSVCVLLSALLKFAIPLVLIFGNLPEFHPVNPSSSKLPYAAGI